MTSDLADLKGRIRRTRSVLDARSGEARSAVRQVRELSTEVEELSMAREDADRVSGVLTQLGVERDAAARAQIEQLVTAGLQTIFDDEDSTSEKLTFHLIESQARGATQIDFAVRTHLADGSSYDTDVLSARGGGMAAVVGLLLRVVLILLTRAVGARAPDLLVLDETLAHLSREYLDRAGQFLATLAQSTGLQILMVTHSPELTEHADVTYRLRLGSDGSTVAVRE